MNKYLAAILLTFLLPFSGNAAVDLQELIGKWRDTKQNDSTRIASITKVIKSMGSSENDSCLLFSKELIQFGHRRENDSCIVHGNFLLHQKNLHLKGAMTIMDSLGAMSKYFPLKLARHREADWFGMAADAFMMKGKIDSALHYTEKALAISTEAKDSVEMARSHTYMGRIYVRSRQFAKADQAFSTSSRLLHNSTDTFNVAQLEHEYLRFLAQSGQTKKAKEKLAKILALVEDNREQYPRSYARALIRKGSIEVDESNYIGGMQTYLKGLKFTEDTKQNELRVHFHGRIANIYESMQDYRMAAKYTKQTIDHFSAVNDTANLIVGHMQLGHIYYLAEPSDKRSETELKIARDLSDSFGDKFKFNLSVMYLAQHYAHSGQLDLARTSMETIRPMLENHPADHVRLEYLIADAMIAKMQGQCKKASEVAERALQIRGTKAEFEQRRDILAILYECAKKEGNQLKAFEYLQLHNSALDSLSLEERQLEFSRLTLKHTLAQEHLADSLAHAAEQVMLKEQLSNAKFQSRALALGGAMFLLLSLLILYQNRKVRQGKKKTEQLLLSEKAHSEALMKEQAKVQLKSLTKQMDPHFMFNSLQSISNYVSENDGEAANRYLARFAQLMRQSLNYSQVDSISLEDELELLETYLELERLRFGHQFAFEIHVDKRLDTYEIVIPPMFIQPHVENAVWHGIRPRVNRPGALIRLDFRKVGDFLHCIISDNGIGRKASNNAKEKTRKEHVSVGTKNMDKRVELINQLNTRPISIHVSDLDETGEFPGTRVEVQFPL